MLHIYTDVRVQPGRNEKRGVSSTNPAGLVGEYSLLELSGTSDGKQGNYNLLGSEYGDLNSVGENTDVVYAEPTTETYNDIVSIIIIFAIFSMHVDVAIIEMQRTL